MSSQTALWKFDQIADHDPDRARALQVAPPCVEISRQIVAALNAAVLNGSARFGLDESEGIQRAIIQFHVGQQLYDWFFNAHTGYRAQFRISWERGRLYNAELVGMLRGELARELDAEIEVRRLNSSFEDIGFQRVARRRLLSSLVPDLSKVWFCGKLIGQDGKILDLLPGLSGPRLVFSENEHWAAIYADESHAWLDLKGAFLGESGFFQIKDPIGRAKNLQCKGYA
jgi:hypothetical protein